MPRKAAWLQQVPSAIECLRAFPAPVVDRSTVEKLFKVSRRDAIRLLHRFGGFQAGRTFLIDRLELITRLEALFRTDEYQQEARRRERLSERLAETQREWKARRISIPVRNPAHRITVEGLPVTTRLTKGRLEIEFKNAVDLLQQLADLSRAISDDYDRFEQLLDGQDPS